MTLRTMFKQGGILLASMLMLVSALFLVFSNATSAQSDEITLGVSPQILELTANPGETLTNVFRLTNASEDSVQIKTTPKNFTPRGEEGAVDLTEDKTSYSLADWITVTPEVVTIEATKTQDFSVAIAVPDSAEPGSHFGSVVFQTIPPGQEGSAALVSQEIAPVILVRIAGDTVERAEIVEFKPESGFYSNQTAVNLISRIKNTGNVHFKPVGEIVIKNMLGQEQTTIELDRRNVLPDSIRQITTKWLTGGFRLGRYTATLTLVYGESNEIVTAETSFFIFPYQTIVPIVLGLGILLFVLYKGRKRIVKALKVLSGKDEAEKSQK